MASKCAAARAGVVKEAKRDPAGGKFGLDPHFVRHRGMFGAQLVGDRRVVLIEELAGEKPAFDPPFVAVDETRGIAWGGQHDVGRRADLVGVAQFVDLREKKARVSAKGQGNRGEKLVARRFIDHGGTCLGERQHIGPGQGGGAKCPGDLLLVEQTIGTKFMVGSVQIGVEIRFHLRFELGVEVGFAPHRAHQGGRFARLAVVGQNARKSELARRSLGIRAAEKSLDERAAFAIAEEGFLAALLQPVERGPGRVCLHEGLQPLEAGFTRKAPQRDPFKGHSDGFVLCGYRRAVATRKVAGLIKRDRLGKAGQVAFLLRREVRREYASLRRRLATGWRDRPRSNESRQSEIPWNRAPGREGGKWTTAPRGDPPRIASVAPRSIPRRGHKSLQRRFPGCGRNEIALCAWFIQSYKAARKRTNLNHSCLTNGKRRQSCTPPP